MNPSLPSVVSGAQRSRGSAARSLPAEIGRVHHAFGPRLHGMSGDAVDDDLGRIAGKGFPANLPRRTAVQGVSSVRPEHSQIQFVHAPADLLIGREADSDQPVLPLRLPQQPLDQSHDHRHARFVVGAEQRSAAGGHDVFAHGRSKLRRCRRVKGQARFIRELDDAAVVPCDERSVSRFCRSSPVPYPRGRERPRSARRALRVLAGMLAMT